MILILSMVHRHTISVVKYDSEKSFNMISFSTLKSFKLYHVGQYAIFSFLVHCPEVLGHFKLTLHHCHFIITSNYALEGYITGYVAGVFLRKFEWPCHCEIVKYINSQKHQKILEWSKLCHHIQNNMSSLNMQ